LSKCIDTNGRKIAPHPPIPLLVLKIEGIILIQRKVHRRKGVEFKLKAVSMKNEGEVTFFKLFHSKKIVFH
jgi:hypothetical protein